MGILQNQLTKSNLGLKGSTPAVREDAKNTSTMHFQSSINNKPEIAKAPSVLDLDGKTPSKYKNPDTGVTY